jgi:hypothetical protein
MQSTLILKQTIHMVCNVLYKFKNHTQNRLVLSVLINKIFDLLQIYTLEILSTLY